MNEKRQSIGIAKNRKAVILDAPLAEDNLLMGVTNKGVPIYQITSNENQLWPDYTGIAGQIFICMFSNEIIYAEEIGCKNALRELVKDIGCTIEEFFGTDEEFVEQEWRFAKVC